MKRSFRDLYIWQASVDLAVDIVELSSAFPRHQQRVLADQMQRAAVSVPSNIAEGKGRLSHKELRHFLGIARSSLFELSTQIEVAARVRWIDGARKAALDQTIDQLGAGINNLLRCVSSTA